ncbi:MAG: D-2-hydroxyacid dehydrogenase [Proteobacteria bacterium]|nr:D-2-hydroxyacid dehydrogenase [Pseudomonadota bacterium]
MRENSIKALLCIASLFVAATGHAGITIEQLVEQARIEEGDVAVREMPRWRGASKILIREIGIGVAEIAQEFDVVEIIAVRTVGEALQHAGDADAIIGFCDAQLIAAAEKLLWVQIFGAGAERCLRVAEIASGDLILTNMQKMSSPVIAEHAIAMMLSLSRKLPQFVRAMERGEWARNATATAGMAPVAGKTLLVVGLGGIGSEVARLGAALGMRVMATRNSSRFGPDYVDYVGLSDELHDLAAAADVIISALPLTNSTRDLFDQEFFAAVKPGALFINVGRGKSVVTAALIDALDTGRISGAGLDVTEPEPLPTDHPLWRYENVIVTPHVSSSGGEIERHRVLLMENLKRYIAGDRLLNVVDPEKGY